MEHGPEPALESWSRSSPRPEARGPRPVTRPGYGSPPGGAGGRAAAPAPVGSPVAGGAESKGEGHAGTRPRQGKAGGVLTHLERDTEPFLPRPLRSQQKRGGAGKERPVTCQGGSLPGFLGTAPFYPTTHQMVFFPPMLPIWKLRFREVGPGHTEKKQVDPEFNRGLRSFPNPSLNSHNNRRRIPSSPFRPTEKQSCLRCGSSPRSHAPSQPPPRSAQPNTQTCGQRTLGGGAGREPIHSCYFCSALNLQQPGSVGPGPAHWSGAGWVGGWAQAGRPGRQLGKTALFPAPSLELSTPRVRAAQTDQRPLEPGGQWRQKRRKKVAQEVGSCVLPSRGETTVQGSR